MMGSAAMRRLIAASSQARLSVRATIPHLLDRRLVAHTPAVLLHTSLVSALTSNDRLACPNSCSDSARRTFLLYMTSRFCRAQGKGRSGCAATEREGTESRVGGCHAAARASTGGSRSCVGGGGCRASPFR